jgi:hypothetical protein
MNLVANIAQPFPILHDQGFIPTRKQVTALPTDTIKARRKTPLKPRHSSHKVRLRCLNCQVVVVSHDNKRVKNPPQPLAGLEKTSFERGARSFAFENPGSLVPAIDHMIDRLLIFKANFSSHCH